MNLRASPKWADARSGIGVVFWPRLHGRQLWISDGTTAGTILLKNIGLPSLSSFPSQLTDLNGVLLFTADDGIDGQELWKSDGSTAGTVLVKDINPRSR